MLTFLHYKFISFGLICFSIFSILWDSFPLFTSLYTCIYVCVCVCVYIYIYIYIIIKLHWQHSFQTLSCYQFLSSIISGKSSMLYLVSIQSWCNSLLVSQLLKTSITHCNGFQTVVPQVTRSPQTLKGCLGNLYYPISDRIANAQFYRINWIWKIFKQVNLIHRLSPTRYYHFMSEWSWE